MHVACEINFHNHTWHPDPPLQSQGLTAAPAHSSMELEDSLTHGHESKYC